MGNYPLIFGKKKFIERNGDKLKFSGICPLIFGKKKVAKLAVQTSTTANTPILKFVSNG